MTVHIDGVEWLYLITNCVAWGFTLWAIRDAQSARRAVHKLNGRAREIVAWANVRREVLRFAVQSLLVLLGVPALFTIQDTPLLNPFVLILIAISQLLLLSSVFDTRDRRRVLFMVQNEIAATQSAGEPNPPDRPYAQSGDH